MIDCASARADLPQLQPELPGLLVSDENADLGRIRENEGPCIDRTTAEGCLEILRAKYMRLPFCCGDKIAFVQRGQCRWLSANDELIAFAISASGQL